MLELVPGLLDGLVLADDPVVLPEPDIALFSFTAPLESRQWVAAETPDGLGEAPGVVLDGGELVCAPATRIPDARTNAAPNSLFDIAFSLDWRRDACEGRSNQLIARLLITIAIASSCNARPKTGVVSRTNFQNWQQKISIIK